MSEIENYCYGYLRSQRYEIHEEHEQFVRPETLAEMQQYETIEFYSRERILELSRNGLITDELKKRIVEMLRLRKDHPEGSNQECMYMDMIRELIGKLDLEDFRTLSIGRIVNYELERWWNHTAQDSDIENV